MKRRVSKAWKKLAARLPRLGNNVLLALFLLVVRSSTGREVALTLLQTTDLHGRLDNPIPERPGDLPQAGLFRLASLMEAVRAETPNVLRVDSGDTLQGTPGSRASGGRLMVRAMELLRYDAWVPGNHDFDWGCEAFRDLHDRTGLTMLAANIGGRPGAPPPLPKIRPFVICEVDGVRVALIGLTTPGIPNWLVPELLGPLTVSASVPALEAIMPRVRAERPDVWVLIVHQGHRPQDDCANEINAIARAFPEFDVILGGHTHESVAGREVNGALYLQAGCHGHFLGRVDLTYDTVARRVTRRVGRLIPVTPDTPAHPALETELGPEWRRPTAALDRRIGEAAAPLSAGGAPPGLTAVAALLRAAIAEATGADIVLHGQLSGAALDVGPIRERDLWRVVPYENRLGLAWLTFGEVREILEENMTQWGTGSFMGARGVAGLLRPEAPAGKRVAGLTRPDGSVPHSRRRWAVAFNSHTLASAGLRFPRLREIVRRPESRFEFREDDTREVLRAYVRKHSPLQPPDDPEEGLRVERPAAGPSHPSETDAEQRRKEASP